MHKITQFLINQWRFTAALGVLIVAIAGSVSGVTAVTNWLVIAFCGAIAVELCIGMIRDIFRGKYGVDILAVVAIVSTLAVGEYWASVVIVLMLTGGEALEAYANERARAELTALMNRAPTTAHKLMVDGSTRRVPIDSVHVRDTIVVRPGELIPIDGVIMIGESSLDESSLTGESAPVYVKPGDKVMSGAVNGETPLTIRTTHIARDSQYAQIVELVKAASDSRAPFVRLADRYAVPFTFTAFAIAGIAWYVTGDARRFAEVLVVATPCPLLLAAPIAMISGMSRAAKHGIIVKNGAVLERLSRIKTAAFDKTGTLTTGQLGFDKLLPTDGVTARRLLEVAASAEQRSGHITALTIMEEAHRQKISPKKIAGIREIAGGGIQAKLGRQTVLVGRREFLVKYGVAESSIPEPKQTAVCVALGGKYLGAVTFTDHVRPEAKDTLQQLLKHGIEHIVMLTGDKKATARSIATFLGVTDVYADCLPKDKLEILQTFPNRPVMMTGDGVNDAPVLAASDVGIAMGARGATAASESADVVILVDDLSRVSLVVAIAQRTIRIGLQSVLVGIALSIVLMCIAAFGLIPAVVGAGLQEVVDVVVIVNALRAHGGR